ncbi:MAG: tyrosine-protein phosphatase [Planctomycetes bacterium]|nr:tyrosine-protein phosphatase [Planctomycetota bacterium]
MVASNDPHGINKAGSPGSIERSIDSWGYIHGRQDRTRLIIGGAVFLVGALTIILAFLLYRFGGSNVHKASADFSRSRELSGPELKRLIHENGIKTVIRLVGGDDGNQAAYEEEVAAVAETDAKLVMAPLPTSRLPWRSELSRLFQALDKAERPIHVHCEAGSDRSGLVSAIWLHDYLGEPMETARKQMAFFPYGHVSFGDASELGRFLDMYEEFASTHPGVSIKHWVRDHYFEEKPGREIAAWYDGVVYRPAG